MAFIFNTRNIFKNIKLLTFPPQNTFIFKSPSTLNSLITRNVTWQPWQHNALRRIAEKKQRRIKLLKKLGQNIIEENKVSGQKVFVRSGIKTSKLKEMFNKENKEKTLTKKKERKEVIF
jgi:hypothetical protein